MSSLVPSAPGALASAVGAPAIGAVEPGAAAGPTVASDHGATDAAGAALGIRPPLRRPRACAVSGVSAGLARHLGAPGWAVRALFLLLALFGGAGALLYAWCWAFTPWERGDETPTRRAPVAWLLTAAAAVGTLIAAFVIPSAMGSVSYVGEYGAIFPTSVVVGVVGLCVLAGLWAAFVDRADPARGPRHAVVVRVVDVGILALLFALLLGEVGRGGWPLLVCTLTTAAGVGVVLASSLVERVRELSGERIKRIREEQRAEMAAHLHDSVLQTLALIQNRAGASSEAARLARAQERELRAWLYDGDAPADSDLATDLRDYAGALELDYPVRIDVVSAGLSTERASGEVAAAAREAMLNAARHAGGDVSVYIEGRGTGVDVFIRDRGAGFDPDAVPSDRLGVRESIVGRMRRVGGWAEIRSRETGTEVHLRLHGGGS